MKKLLLIATLSLFLFPSLMLPASADHDPWDGVIRCESTYNFGLEHGIYSGAFQFDQQTWDGVASRHHPDLVGVRPSSATPAVQYDMAWHLYDERGTQPWPYCGQFFSGEHEEGAFLRAVAHDPVRWYLHALWIAEGQP